MGLLGRTGRQSEQTRFHHSVMVAVLAAQILERAGAPLRVIRHAASAALLHDASQWALSHSCEGAFACLTGYNNGKITHAMIFDSKILPERYHLGRTLKSLDLDQDCIWGLLKKTPTPLAEETYWRAAADLFACPLNPDTIDGIARACAIFRIECPPREVVADCLALIGGRLSVRRKDFGILDAFWKAKDAVYSRHIHNTDSIVLELRYSLAVCKAFPEISLAAALDLTDEEVLGRAEDCLPQMDKKNIAAGYKLRFRRPRRYKINLEAWTEAPSVPVACLGSRYSRAIMS